MNLKSIRAIVLAGLAGLLVLTTALPAAAYTEKWRSGGWHHFQTDNRYASTWLIDRTPRTAIFGIFVQKKAGPTPCRVRSVRMERGQYVYTWRNITKYARTRSKVGVWRFSRGRDRTIKVTFRTNGRCIVGAGVK